jgi:hypothetical protein
VTEDGEDAGRSTRGAEDAIEAASGPPLPGAGARPGVAAGVGPGVEDGAARPGEGSTQPSGPPWPRLVATGPYAPPRLVKWPVVAGVVLFGGYVAALSLFVGGRQGGPGAGAAWLAAHGSQIVALGTDVSKLRSDNPANGGSLATWYADWVRFQADLASASAVAAPPDPAGTAWTEMLTAYRAGTAAVLFELRTGNTGGQSEALSELAQGDRAARRFDAEMGLGRGPG